jgi:DNA-binding NarL/FixJ family response regulator
MTLQFPPRLALFKCADGGPGRSERVGEGLMSRHPARVLIVDHHPLSNEQIKGIVAPHFEVIGIVRDQESLPRALGAKPDIILINSTLAMDSRFEIVTGVLRQLPNARIILYSNQPAKASKDLASRASEISHNSPRALCGVSDGVHSWARSPQMAKAASPEMVTDREYEVLALLAAGYPMKQIAFRLGITYRTVTFHKYRMMNRLGIKTNAGLMTYALKRDMSEHMARAENAAAA